MKLITIEGTSPEIIKLAYLIPLLNNNFDHKFVYTGKHFSPNMSDIRIDELKVKPDYDLQSNSSDISTMRTNLLPVSKDINPDCVAVCGDTNSNMAAVLAAEDIKSKIIHVEAGVRDFDLHVPEEPLRIQIDEMSDYLFPPSNFCTTVLLYENTRGKIFTTANLIVDVCKGLSRIATSRKLSESIPQEYLLLTLHRPENVDNPNNLRLLMNHIASTNHPVVFPVHPRTKKNLQHFNISIPSNITMVDPLGYMDFLSLVSKSKLIDGFWGYSRRSITIKKSCITLRHTSARCETVLLKTNILFPPGREDNLDKVIKKMLTTKIQKNPYDDNVAQNIPEIMKSELT